MNIHVCSTWHNRADSASAAATSPVADVVALSGAVNPSQ